MKANFQSLIKLNYRLLFSCFDYIPLSFECSDPEAYNSGVVYFWISAFEACY